MNLSRRDFLQQGAAAGLLGATPLSLPFLRAPWIRRSALEPVVIASANGHWFRNGGSETCVERAWRMMGEGQDVLDALIAGVNIVELDPVHRPPYRSPNECRLFVCTCSHLTRAGHPKDNKYVHF